VCLRRAEDVRVHAVLLGEDEGDNALRQRGLRASSSSVNKRHGQSSEAAASERKTATAFQPAEQTQNSAGGVVRACKVQKRKRGCAALYRHRGHIDRHARPAT
jgi:hypothetical protein